MVFTGFSINYMIRINVNIALIDMLDSVHRKPSNTPNVSIECVDTNDNQNNNSTINLNNEVADNKHTRLSIERNVLDFLAVIESHSKATFSKEKTKFFKFNKIFCHF